MITCDDLEIFVLTYNRADMLEQTLVSISRQTVKGFRTIVLDNRSDDHTPEVVSKFKCENVDLLINDVNLGGLGNIRRAQQLASRKFVMLFHDDDLMHPSFVEDALLKLNSVEDVVLLGAKWQPDAYPTNESWQKVNCRLRLFGNVADFAAYLYSANNFHFGSSIYKTDVFKKVPIDVDSYGKILDRPILLDVAAYGTTLLLDDCYIKYRLHEDQDTNDSKTGPFLHEVIALNKKYHTIMGDSLFTNAGRMFLRKNVSYLRGNYSWCSDRGEQPFSRFLVQAYRNKAATPLSLCIGICINAVAAVLKMLKLPLLQENRIQ